MSRIASENFNTLKHVTLVTFGMFMGRLLGYVREWFIAFRFGSSHYADSIILSLSLPELLSSVVSSSTIALILFKELHNYSDYKGTTVRNVRKGVIALYALCTAIFFMVSLFFLPEEIFLIVACIILLTSLPNILSNLKMATLQFHEDYRFISFSTLVFNFILIIALIFFLNPFFIVFIGIPVASIFRYLFVKYGASNFEFKDNRGNDHIPHFLDSKSHTFSIFLGLITSAVSSLPWIILPLADRLFAVRFESGSISCLSYAEKLYLLPVSLILTVIPFVKTPRMFLSAKEKCLQSFLSSEMKEVLKALFYSSLVAFIACIFSKNIANLVFFGTSLDSAALESISQLLQCYSGAIIFSSPTLFLINIFFSIGERKLVFTASIVSIAIKIMFLLCVYVYDFPLMSLPISTSLSFAIFFGILMFYLLKKRSTLMTDVTLPA